MNLDGTPVEDEAAHLLVDGVFDPQACCAYLDLQGDPAAHRQRALCLCLRAGTAPMAT
ncbi:hypothetical protein [Luteimonas sp. A611]